MNDEILKELQYNGAMLEEIRSQNKALLEGQKDQASISDIRRLQQDVTELKQDMKVVKAAVTATNHDLAEHKSLPAHVAHGHA
jgi:outer membrane murein-binding lipoprotein Lpp